MATAATPPVPVAVRAPRSPEDIRPASNRRRLLGSPARGVGCFRGTRRTPLHSRAPRPRLRAAASIAEFAPTATAMAGKRPARIAPEEKSLSTAPGAAGTPSPKGCERRLEATARARSTISEEKSAPPEVAPAAHSAPAFRPARGIPHQRQTLQERTPPAIRRPRGPQ